jgi:hypothetical protein
VKELLKGLVRRGDDAADGSLLSSMPCSARSLASPTFQAWAARIGEGAMHMHRKIWEYCFIAQALDERGMLTAGKRGLGFAVGKEPLPALFASLGCDVVATDQDEAQAAGGGWVQTAQHAASLDALNERGICPADEFARRVNFRTADMRNPPSDLGLFDFVWSCSSFEHLGSREFGERFVTDTVRYLRPGGISVHTTELHLGPGRRGIDHAPTVLFRRRDFEHLRAQLKRRGARVSLDFSLGNEPADLVVDRPPYAHDVHLRIDHEGHVVTSYGLIVAC